MTREELAAALTERFTLEVWNAMERCATACLDLGIVTAC